MPIPAAPLPFPIATKARTDFFLPSFAFMQNTFFTWRKKQKASRYGTVQLYFCFKENQFSKRELEVCYETSQYITIYSVFINGYHVVRH